MPLDPNIDPALQEPAVRLDPALAFLEDLENDPPTPGFASDNNDLPPNVYDPGYQGTSATSNSLTLVEFGRLVKKHKTFTDNSEADFDAYCTTASAEERNILLYAAVLEHRDMLRASSNVADGNWTISEGLQTSIRAYSRAMVLSPTLSAYRGNGAEIILKVLRDLNIQDVPPEKDIAHIKMVVALIRKELTNARNATKAKIAGSLQPDSPARNIADLCQALIGKDGILPTLQMWMRVAFLRWHIVKYPDIAEEHWWLQVDQTLSTWRTNMKTEAEVSKAFTKMYYADEDKYGKAADSHHNASSPTNLPRWQKALNDAAATVQGKTVASKKRKIRPE